MSFRTFSASDKEERGNNHKRSLAFQKDLVILLKAATIT